jgi:hypothetical protein
MDREDEHHWTCDRYGTANKDGFRNATFRCVVLRGVTAQQSQSPKPDDDIDARFTLELT